MRRAEAVRRRVRSILRLRALSKRESSPPRACGRAARIRLPRVGGLLCETARLMRGSSALCARFCGERRVSCEGTIGGADRLTALATRPYGEPGVLREAALLSWHALSAHASDLAPSFRVHRREPAFAFSRLFHHVVSISLDQKTNNNAFACESQLWKLRGRCCFSPFPCEQAAYAGGVHLLEQFIVGAWSGDAPDAGRKTRGDLSNVSRSERSARAIPFCEEKGRQGQAPATTS